MDSFEVVDANSLVKVDTAKIACCESHFADRYSFKVKTDYRLGDYEIRLKYTNQFGEQAYSDKI